MNSPEKLPKQGWEELRGQDEITGLVMSEQYEILSHELKEIRSKIDELETSLGGSTYHETSVYDEEIRVYLETVHRMHGSSFYRVLINSERTDRFEGGDLAAYEYIIDRASDTLTCDTDVESFYRCKSIQQFMELSDIKVPYFNFRSGRLDFIVSGNYREPEPDDNLPVNNLKLFDLRESQIGHARFLSEMLGHVSVKTFIPTEC